MSYDEGEHVKEVFAHFGLAYYLAGVFEVGLTHALLTLDFLHKQADEIKRVGQCGFDRTKYEAEFDAFYAEQETKTLGKLVKRLHELSDTDDALRDLIAEAKERRDFLAHHFWRERSEEFIRRSGRDNMLAELQEAQQLFQNADRAILTFT